MVSYPGEQGVKKVDYWAARSIGGEFSPGSEVDDLVCLTMPEPFYGVGQFYFDFSQVSDQEVNELLDRATQEIGEPGYASVVAATED